MQKKSRILGPDGNPMDLPLNAEQTASLGWITQTFATHPTRGLTPERLNRYLQAAEMGSLTDMADLGRDIQERDGHIAAELGKRIRAILTLPWQLQPPRNASAEEKKITEAMQEWVADIPDFEDVQTDALDAIGHGFSALEYKWANNQRFTLPATITHRPQRWFQTLQHDGNALRLIDGSPNGADLWQYGWIIHKHRARSGFLGSSGLFRTLAWPYLLKAYALGDWAEFLEVYGQPIRLGEYMQGASQAEQDSLLDAVASMGHNAAGIISSNMKVTFHDAVAGQHDAFLAMVKYCESLCSKAILGGTLTSGADGKSSTNALGKVHEEVRQDLMHSDARQLASTFTKDLLLPIYLLNFPGADPARCPRFRYITEQKENIETFAKALPALVSTGMKISVEWAQNKIGIPVAKDGEAILTVSPAATPTPQAREKLNWRAVLTSQTGQPLPGGQAVIDEAITTVTDRDYNKALLAMLEPVIAAVQSGETPEALLDGLLQAYPQMDIDSLGDVLAQAFALSDIIGRVYADTV